MRDGDAASFEAFFRSQYAGLVRTISLVIASRDAATDIAQETFTRLYPRWRRVSEYERPDAWIRTVAFRLARRKAKRMGAEQPLAEADLPAPTAADHSDLRAAIRALPYAQRAAVVLHYFEGRPASEAAAMLGCSPSTVGVHLHRARTSLARLLGEVNDVAR